MPKTYKKNVMIRAAVRYVHREGGRKKGVIIIKAYGEDQGDAASDGLGTVQDGLVAQPELLVAGGILPADDGRAEQEDLDALAGGQRGSDATGVVVDAHRGLGEGLLCPGGQRGRLVGAVDHVCCCWPFSFFLLLLLLLEWLHSFEWRYVEEREQAAVSEGGLASSVLFWLCVKEA